MDQDPLVRLINIRKPSVSVQKDRNDLSFYSSRFYYQHDRLLTATGRLLFVGIPVLYCVTPRKMEKTLLALTYLYHATACQ